MVIFRLHKVGQIPCLPGENKA